MSYADEVELLARSMAQLTARNEDLEQQQGDLVLAARDIVVERLRLLTAALTNAGPPKDEFPARHVASDPGHALVAALQELPLVAGSDRPSLIDVLGASGSGSLPLWQDAARAATSMEPYTAALRDLPGPTAWGALRDVADLAASVPHLDAGLARWAGADHAALLTDPASHGAVRIAAEELRVQVPSAGPGGLVLTEATPARPIQIHGIGDVPEATRRMSAILDARGADVSAVEVRAVATALAEGFEAAGKVLRAAGDLEPRFKDVADSLDRAVPAVRRVYSTPMETLTPASPVVRYLATEVRGQLRGLGELVERIERMAPGANKDTALKRAAEPALAWAAEAPRAAAAMDNALRASHEAGRLLGPVERIASDTPAYSWVRAATPEDGDEPRALAASRAAREAVTAAAPLLADLTARTSSAQGPDAAERAAAAVAAVSSAVDERGRGSRPSLLPDHPRERVGTRRETELAKNRDDERRRSRSASVEEPAQRAPRL